MSYLNGMRVLHTIFPFNDTFELSMCFGLRIFLVVFESIKTLSYGSTFSIIYISLTTF